MAPATVIISIISAHLLCFGVLVFAMSRRLPQINGLLDVALGTTLISLSYVLQFIDGQNQLSFLTLVNHNFATFGVVLLLTALRRLFGQSAPSGRTLVVAAAFYSALQILMEVIGFPIGRHILLSLIAAGVFALSCTSALKAARGNGHDVRFVLRMYAAGCVGVTLLHLLKAGYMLRDGLPALELTHWYQLVFYLYMSVMAVLLMPLLMWIIFRRLTNELEGAALRDPLTGALNRRGMWQRLEQHLANRGARGAVLLLLDLDDFKRINDSHGHLVGDDVLRRVAESLCLTIREGDFVARTGGEEFIIGCLDATQEQAQAIAQRLREQLAALDIATDTSRPLRLTASIGVSHPLHAMTDVDRALHEADVALYQGKLGGRNRVVVFRELAEGI